MYGRAIRAARGSGLTIRDAVDDLFWDQQRSLDDLLARAGDDAGGADVLISLGRASSQCLVFGARQDCDLTPFGLLETDSHGDLSVVDFAAVADSRDDDGLVLFDEDDAPIADAQPAPGLTFQTFHIPLPGLGESLQLGIDPLANIGRQLSSIGGERRV